MKLRFFLLVLFAFVVAVPAGDERAQGEVGAAAITTGLVTLQLSELVFC